MQSRLTRLLLISSFLAALAFSTGGVAGAANALSDARALKTADARQASVAGRCPSAIGLTASPSTQEEAMQCLVNETRERYGLPPLVESQSLLESATDKSGDLIGCNEFSHTACGREFSHWIRETGYMSPECWRVGENLAWGVDREGTVAAIFNAWMHSPTHRENILGDFGEIGIDLRVGRMGGLTGVHVWTQHFGSHC